MLTSVNLHFVFGAGSRKCLIEYGARVSLTCSECLLDCLFKDTNLELVNLHVLKGISRRCRLYTESLAQHFVKIS